MARNTSTVYLGFEDELVTERNQHLVDYTTNRVGGQPCWPAAEIAVPNCPICGLRRPLVLQIYAPLDNSPFHRVLYLFACVQAVCSNQTRGWQCVRVQQLDRQASSPLAAAAATPVVVEKRPTPYVNWCSGADDWGDADDGGDAMAAMAVDGVGGMGADEGMMNTAEDEANCNETNGNVVPLAAAAGRMDNDDDDDDDDDCDDSNSLEDASSGTTGSQSPGDAVAVAFDKLHVHRQPDDAGDAADDGNANGGGGGAVGGRRLSPGASAEIEAGATADDELVSCDVPQLPRRDLVALLKQTAAVPAEASVGGELRLRAFYVAVEREATTAAEDYVMSEHVRELLLEYQTRDEKLNTGSPEAAAGGSAAELGGGRRGGGGGGAAVEDEEKYEKGVPAHGDVTFHNFVSVIQQNPGQILRYSRNTLPLLCAPLPADQRRPPPCPNCGAATLCELQLLPTVIPMLRFAGGGEAPVPMEFGNVLVYTCQQSCWDTPDRMRLELVLVQPEV